ALEISKTHSSKARCRRRGRDSMLAAWLWLAADAPPRPGFWQPRLLAATLILVGIILLGALVIYWIDRWRKQSAPPSLTASAQLANFRELYEEGDLSQAEFDRIRARLTPLLRQELE